MKMLEQKQKLSDTVKSRRSPTKRMSVFHVKYKFDQIHGMWPAMSRIATETFTKKLLNIVNIQHTNTLIQVVHTTKYQQNRVRVFYYSADEADRIHAMAAVCPL